MVLTMQQLGKPDGMCAVQIGLLNGGQMMCVDGRLIVALHLGIQVVVDHASVGVRAHGFGQAGKALSVTWGSCANQPWASA